MKKIIFVWGLILGSCLYVQKANAIVSINKNSVVTPKQYTVFGIYEGYNNGVVRILLSDGTRQGLPFNGNLLKTISITSLGTHIRLVVDNGTVMSFERYSK